MKSRVLTALAPGATDDVLPRRNLELLRQVRFFVVEELRSARRFLKHCHRDIDIDALSFEVLNEHTGAMKICVWRLRAMARSISLNAAALALASTPPCCSPLSKGTT